MATIKDIARAAGVSQGTVSNVLNGKGNVSSQKIQLVQETARRLGYAMNQRAQALRRGSSNTLALVLPDLYNRQYADFYVSFSNYAKERGYQVALYLTGDSPQAERQAIGQILSGVTAAAAVFTCLVGGENAYLSAGLDKVLYMERSPGFPCPLLGFDMGRVGAQWAQMALEKGYKQVALLTENPDFSSQRQFCQAFEQALGDQAALKIYHTDQVRCPNDVFSILSSAPVPQALFVTNYAFAVTAASILKHFHVGPGMGVYGLSPLFTMPGGEIEKYELNYRLMARTAAGMLIDSLQGKELPARERLLPGEGHRVWLPAGGGAQKPGALTVVTLESPSARILKDISQLYTKATGVRINVAVYSYDGLNEVLSNLENTNSFDVIRIDSRRLSWYAQKAFAPLQGIDPGIQSVLDTFLPGLSKEYAHFDGTLYALPSTPSSQLLFYRKDLFENAAWRRQYAERYQQELRPPATFQEFNRVAGFFTRKLNPQSPVPYGTTLTLGNSSVAAREFLTRFFSHTRDLYEDGRIRLTGPEALTAMEELLATKELIGAAPCGTWQESAREFTKGNVAMTVMFSNFASGIVATDSQVLDKIGYAPVPGGNPMTGGSAIGVCRYSVQKEEALRFIRWLCSKEVATAMTLMGTMSPCKQTYENYEVMDLYPWLVMAKDNFALSHTSYAPGDRSCPFDEPRFLGILGMAVHTAYHGIMPPREALRFAQTTFEKTDLCRTV